MTNKTLEVGILFGVNYVWHVYNSTIVNMETVRNLEGFRQI
jgi:hypothetical protein